jgi:hypothetical protein
MAVVAAAVGQSTKIAEAFNSRTVGRKAVGRILSSRKTVSSS